MRSESAAALRRQVRSVLVIKFRYLGDMVLLSPVIRNLRIAFPAAHLSVLADRPYTEALRHIPELDEAIAYPRAPGRLGSRTVRLSALVRLLRDLRRRRFDLVIDLTDGSTSRLIVRWLRAPVRVGYSSGPDDRRAAPYNIRAQRFGPDGPHFVDRFLEPLKALGLAAEERVPVLAPRAVDQHSVAALLARHGLHPHEFIAVHPGARVPSRCWPAANYAELADRLARETSRRIVLLGSAGERGLADAVVQASATKPVNLAGQLAFGELLALLQACRLFIGNDSGPTHVAAAAGAPVVVLFGLQPPSHWAPLGAGHIVVRPSMPCSPCLFPDLCEPPHPHRTYCVQRIPVGDVVAAALHQLASRA